MSERRFMTVSEVAKELKVTSQAIYQWVNRKSMVPVETPILGKNRKLRFSRREFSRVKRNRDQGLPIEHGLHEMSGA